MSKSKTKLLVGTCSWTDPTLIESGWYPARIKDDADKRLRFYAEHFPIVENDAAFYALPSQKQALLWAERTPDEFVMNFKAFATLTTHHTDPKRLPKDIRAFRARAGELGVDLTFLREVDEINLRRREKVVEKALDAVGGSFAGSKIAVLGTAFKPDSDDVRDSPALNIAGQVYLKGAHVTVYDPKAMDNSRRLFPTLTYATSAHGAATGADVVLLLTEWDEFQTLDPEQLGEVVRARVIIDGRNCLDPDAWRAAGWTYIGMGRP